MSERPRDIHGAEVELGPIYWFRQKANSFPRTGYFQAQEGGIVFWLSVNTCVFSFADMEFELAVLPSFQPRPSQPPAGTVRVRIPVGVNANKGWGVPAMAMVDQEKSYRAFDKELREDGYESIVYVEAPLPLPQPITIEGTVGQ